MGNTEPTHRTEIENLNADLQGIIHQLDETDCITSDDADEFEFRATMLAKELQACIDADTDGPLATD